MSPIYLACLFFAFIIVSSILCRSEEKLKGMIVKSSIYTFVIVIFSFLISSIIYMFMDVFTGPTLYGFCYVTDILLPIIISFVSILVIAKIFKYEFKVKIWIYVVALLCAIIAAPIYISYIKNMLAYINDIFSEDLSVFDLVNPDNPFKLSEFIFNALIKIPALVLIFYYVINKSGTAKSEK